MRDHAEHFCTYSSFENDKISTVSLAASFSYGEALFMNSKLIGGVTEFLNTERELNEVIHKHVPVHVAESLSGRFYT